MKYYILVDAELRDLPRKVHEQIINGYTPIGAPFPSPERNLVGRWLQAMTHPRETVTHVTGKLTTINAPYDDFDAPDKRSSAYAGDPNDGPRGDVGLKLPASQELEDAVREANAAHPGSASSEYAPRRTARDEINYARLIQALGPERPEAFIALPAREQAELLASAQALFDDALAGLRKKQQQPYAIYSDPKTPQDVYYKIQELIRLRTGVLSEYAAACSARDPEARPTINVTLRDAQLIDALLESTHAQYPTEHQEAVLRFKRAVHGTQES